VYLANYWRFQFAAIGPTSKFGRRHLSKIQISAIERAAANCPDDACIRLWLAWAHGKASLPTEAISAGGYLDVAFPQVEDEI
jgi:hypothetical protein